MSRRVFCNGIKVFGSFRICQSIYSPVEGGIGGPVVYTRCQQEDNFPENKYCFLEGINYPRDPVVFIYPCN